ncbi:hypothetical protein T492DRAFT_834609 [Pavlovales sp. CCMP2436]|nr:hypothetical protein T492DRAFT_834609 [Pavlovales sp. CCMP2436]
MDGTHYALETLYSIWSREVWRPQITNATMNSDNVGIVVFSAAIKSVLLIARCKFPLFFEFTKNLKDIKVEKQINQFQDDCLLNIDQSKTYTRAFDPCIDDLLGTPEKMFDMLEQKGIEGLFIIDKESVDFDHVNFYINLLHQHQSSPSAPNVLIFVEARFLVMCGVKFAGIAAMVSYDSIEIKWDETSHVAENGIRHYAKAVGAGSTEKAYEFAELAANDQNLDNTRVKIIIVGSKFIEIEHPVNGVNTTAHVSGFYTPSKFRKQINTLMN